MRRITARGSNNRLVPVGPTKVKACKSILFTEGTPEVKIKIMWEEQLVDPPIDYITSVNVP